MEVWLAGGFNNCGGGDRVEEKSDCAWRRDPLTAQATWNGGPGGLGLPDMTDCRLGARQHVQSMQWDQISEKTGGGGIDDGL